MPRPALHKVVAMPSSSFWEGTTGSDTSLTISANLVETLNAWLQRNFLYSRVLGALAAVLGADDFLESFTTGANTGKPIFLLLLPLRSLARHSIEQIGLAVPGWR